MVINVYFHIKINFNIQYLPEYLITPSLLPHLYVDILILVR